MEKHEKIVCEKLTPVDIAKLRDEFGPDVRELRRAYSVIGKLLKNVSRTRVQESYPVAKLIERVKRLTGRGARMATSRRSADYSSRGPRAGRNHLERPKAPAPYSKSTSDQILIEEDSDSEYDSDDDDVEIIYTKTPNGVIDLVSSEEEEPGLGQPDVLKLLQDISIEEEVRTLAPAIMLPDEGEVLFASADQFYRVLEVDKTNETFKVQQLDLVCWYIFADENGRAIANKRPRMSVVCPDSRCTGRCLKEVLRDTSTHLIASSHVLHGHLPSEHLRAGAPVRTAAFSETHNSYVFVPEDADSRGAAVVKLRPWVAYSLYHKPKLVLL